MQLGDIIRSFSDEAQAGEALLGCDDLTLVARVGHAAQHFDESVGDYAAGAVRRFANRAGSEDWLALMTAIERADDPGMRVLAHMVDWSLRQDEAADKPAHAGCGCGGGGGCG